MRLKALPADRLFLGRLLPSLMLVLCLATAGATDAGTDLRGMTPKDAFAHGVALFDADRKDEAAKVFNFIYETHKCHELAPWALFRLSKITAHRANTNEG